MVPVVEDKEGVGLVVPRCCLGASLASAVTMSALAEVVLLDMASRDKLGYREGYRRSTTETNMMTGVRSSLRWLV